MPDPDPGSRDKKAPEPGSVSATLIIVQSHAVPLYLRKEQVSVIYSTFTIYVDSCSLSEYLSLGNLL